MNYEKIYKNLINSRKELNRNKKTGIFEKHHIVPRCFGGTNEKENLVLLTPREHFLAHALLTRMFDHDLIKKAKMCYAYYFMCKKGKYKINSRQYEIAKQLVIKNCSGEYYSIERRNKISKRHKGKKLSDEQKIKISNSRLGDKNPNFNGKSMTLNTKEKISKIHKGKKLSNETKEKLRLANLGKKLSEEHKNKIRISMKK